MSHVLVVGGAGYIGSRLVPTLEKRGHQVGVIDLCWFGFPDFISPCYTADALIATVEDLKCYDTVIFLAGLSNDPMADFDPLQNFTANAAAPAYLAELCKRAEVKTFIHGGSCSVYGFAQEVSEDCTPMTFSPYGVSKLMGEIGILQQRKHMRVVAFRMGTVAGWSPRMRFDLVVNAMTKSALTTGVIHVNDARASRPILGIVDAVEAYVRAVESPRIEGIVNLASENVTVQEIALGVLRMVQNYAKKDAVIEYGNTKEIRSYTVSTKRAEDMGIVFHSGVNHAATEIIDMFSTIHNPEDNRYYNIKTFKALAALPEESRKVY